MRRERLIYWALLLVTLAVFWPLAHCQFIAFDDPAYVTQNPNTRTLTVAHVAWAFRAIVSGNWHPVTLLSHMLDCQLFGLNPAAHHLVNLLFHAANTLLLFHLFKRLTGQLWPPALVAALFALHPLHVESVAWISERKDVLSTFFGLLCLWAYVRYVEKSKALSPSVSASLRRDQESTRRAGAPPWRDEGGKSEVQSPGCESAPRDSKLKTQNLKSRFLVSGDYWGAIGFFALGLMSKPMLVTWPLVLLLLDFWPLGRVPGFGFRVSSPGAAGPGPDAASNSKLHTQNPKPQTRIARPPYSTSLRHLVVEKVPFLMLSIASCVMTFVAQQHQGLVVTLNQATLAQRAANALVAYGGYLGMTVWPRHLCVYYPYRIDLPAWQVLGSAVALALITFAAWRYRRRCPWLIFGWLWFLGTLVPVIGLVQVGSQARADRYMYIPSIGLFAMCVWGLKGVLERGGLAGKRVGVGLAAAALAAGAVVTRDQLRYWHDGEVLFRRALAVTRDNMVAEYDLGSELVRLGRFDEGLQHLRAAVRLNPGYFHAHTRIADLLSRQGRVREAIDEYRQALRYEPSYAPDLAVALNNLAWILATSADPQLRDGAEAVRLAERACQLTQYQVARFIDTLATAYAEAGRFDDAVRTAEKARAAALAAGEPELAERIRRSLELYRAGKPLRQEIESITKRSP